jgi:hypothetical protein
MIETEFFQRALMMAAKVSGASTRRQSIDVIYRVKQT